MTRKELETARTILAPYVSATGIARLSTYNYGLMAYWLSGGWTAYYSLDAIRADFPQAQAQENQKP